jgi:N,N'-diacetyllegionaminate synthase
MVNATHDAVLNAFQIHRTPYIIAEIGANYGGIETVKNMVRAAAAIGVDMVKFQTYRAETISTPGSFFTFEDGSKVPQFEFFKQYELSPEHHDALDALCKELGIAWTSTPSHITDVDLLEKYDLPFYKTGSDDMTNLPFLKAIAKRGKPMLVSTGMCSLEEIGETVEAIFSTGNKNLILLHCVVSYPSKPEDANLRVIETLQKTFPTVPIGLSDHTQDEFTSVLSVPLGAVIIEKHLTLDHALKLADHQASLDPVQFKLLVDRARLASKALGTGVKGILPTEEKWRKAARKSLFAARAIAEGAVITEADIAIRRPSDGIAPKHYESFIGRKVSRDVTEGALLSWDDVA